MRPIAILTAAALAGLALLAPHAALADDDAPSAVTPSSTTAPAPPATTAETGGYVPPHMVPYLGGDIAPFAHIEAKPDMGFIKAGITIVGIAYGSSLFYALATCGAQMDCRAGSAALYAPVVGPFITAAQAPTSGGIALSMFDGGVQLLGAVLLVAGFVSPQKFVVWQDQTSSLKIAPTALGSGAGGGLSLTLSHM
jgi:hypothetical protein